MTEIVTRAELGLRKPKAVHKNVWPEKGGIAIHWGGEPTRIRNHAGCVATWRQWQTFHMDSRGWDDIAYNWGVCQHGYVFTGRGGGVRSAANGTDDANDRYLAVVWLGGLGDPPPSAEALTAFGYIIAAARRGGVGPDVQPHGHFYQTECPGPVLTAFLPSWRVTGGPRFPLAADGWYGPGGITRADSLKAWQAKAGTRVTGLYDAPTASAARGLQRAKGLTIDGLIGSKTWAAAWE